MKTHSIARRLVSMVLLVELIAAVCVTGVAFIYERQTHFRAFDIMLRGRADSLLGAVQDAEDAADNVMLDGSETNIPPHDIYQVQDSSGRIIGKSGNWNGVTCFEKSEKDSVFQLSVQGRSYRVIHTNGIRIVDPGDKGGGIKRYVSIYYGAPTKRAWRAVFSAVTFYAISSLLVLAITGVLMSWLLNRSLAPLRDLAAGASRVSVKSWTFSPPAAARETKELAPLISAMETVLSGLEQSFEVQKRFVGDAAHELKTAVAVVKSSIQLLGMKQRSAPEYEAGLKRSLDDCDRMETIVKQMLTLARIEDESGNDVLNLTTNLADEAQKVMNELGPMALVRELQLNLESQERIDCLIDPEQCHLLFANILINAVQHSPRGAVVTLEMSRGDSFAEMKFIDEGDGIDPRDIPRLFERFSRGDPSRSRSTGGTGLGLSICKAIVDRNQGSIGIDSSPKRGTTVVVRLPLATGISPDNEESIKNVSSPSSS
jgi:signal transduction histidine kinase